MVPEKGPESLGLQKVPQRNLTEKPANKEKTLKCKSGSGVRLDRGNIWMKYEPGERSWNLELVFLNNPILSSVSEFIKSRVNSVGGKKSKANTEQLPSQVHSCLWPS